MKKDIAIGLAFLLLAGVLLFGMVGWLATDLEKSIRDDCATTCEANGQTMKAFTLTGGCMCGDG